MHLPHPSFKFPIETHAKIWQYMDLAQFVSMLQRKQLFFVKANTLRDPYEGIPPEYDRLVKKSSSKMREKSLGGTKHTDDYERKVRARLIRQSRVNGARVLINSWHSNEYESAAMWQLYSQENSGIAIQSTVDRLSRCFRENKSDIIWIGEVEYLDYEEKRTLRTGVMDSFVRKRKSFEYEREVRAVTRLPREVSAMPGRGNSHPGWNKDVKNKVRKINPNDLTDKGKYIDADISILVENVYVAPFSEYWFTEVVESLLSKYKLDKDVMKSDLYMIH